MIAKEPTNSRYTRELRSLKIPLSSNHDISSPLRYPGGKSVLSHFISNILNSMKLRNATYVEPYAGGAGIGLRLLKEGYVSKLVLNDLDPCVFAFWHSVVNQPDHFLNLFDKTVPSIEEWHHQKQVYKNPASILDLGFSFFFLNRTNRSGVINAGVIGGLDQSGKYKINARYNKHALRKKIEFIKDHSQSIIVKNEDGKQVIDDYSNQDNALIYADPPYVNKGGSLYMNSFLEQEHKELASLLNAKGSTNWLLTYDDTELIRRLYQERFCGTFPLSYSASSRRLANELLIVSDKLAPVVRSMQGDK